VIPALHDDDDLVRSTDLADAIDLVVGAQLDPDSERHREHLLRFCSAHPDALHRTCAEGHLTGSACVIEEGSGRLAFLLHAKVGRWLQPGGHADGEANLTQVALDEASEETGLTGLRVARPAVDVDVHVFDAPGEPQHFHLDVRHLVLAPEGSVLSANHESHDLDWFAPDDVERLDLDEGTHRLIRQAQALARTLGGIG
jgi:8-oxo-dGTP pyrophosphatase MutT (NUDIX family)